MSTKPRSDRKFADIAHLPSPQYYRIAQARKQARLKLEKKLKAEIHLPFNLRLKELLALRNMNMQTLAQESGLSKGWICTLYNKNTANPSLSVLRRIGKVLGLTPSELLDGVL